MTFFNRFQNAADTASRRRDPDPTSIAPRTESDARLDRVRHRNISKLYTTRIWL